VKGVLPDSDNKGQRITSKKSTGRLPEGKNNPTAKGRTVRKRRDKRKRARASRLPFPHSGRGERKLYSKSPSSVTLKLEKGDRRRETQVKGNSYLLSLSLKAFDS